MTEPGTLRLLHLSDPHFGTEQPAVAEALVAFAQALQPHALIVSGDLTQRATAEQFEACAQFLARLPHVPRLVIPGNHDLPLYQLITRFAAPFSRYHRFADRLDALAGPAAGTVAGGAHARLDPVLTLPGAVVIGVNTSRRWRQQNGAISTSQIAAVETRLRAAPAGHWRIVVTHHPLQVVRAEDLGDRPLGWRDAVARWSAAGAHLMLSGHIHIPGVLPVVMTPVADAQVSHDPGPVPAAPAGAALTAATHVVGAGTALSDRLVAGIPNSVNVLVHTRAADGGAPQRRVERHDFDARSGRFVPAAVHPLPV